MGQLWVVVDEGEVVVCRIGDHRCRVGKDIVCRMGENSAGRIEGKW